MRKILLYRAGDPKSHKELGDKLRELKDGDYIIDIKKKKNIRSISHNSYYWVVLNIISISTGEYDRDRLHEVCKKKFNGEMVMFPKSGSELIGKTTSDLDSAEFGAYVARVKQWAKDEFDIIIPEREDVDYQRWMEIENSYNENFQG